MLVLLLIITDEESISSTQSVSPTRFNMGMNFDSEPGNKCSLILIFQCMLHTGTTKRLELLEKKVDVLLDHMLGRDCRVSSQFANLQATPSVQQPATPSIQQPPTPSTQQPATPTQQQYANIPNLFEDDWAYSWSSAKDMSPEYWSTTPIPGQQQDIPHTPLVYKSGPRQCKKNMDSLQQQIPVASHGHEQPVPIVVDDQERQPPTIQQQRPPIVQQQQTARIQQWRTPMIGKEQPAPIVVDIIEQQPSIGEQQHPPMVMDSYEQQPPTVDTKDPTVVECQQQQPSMKQLPVLKQVTNTQYSLPLHHSPPRPIKSHDNALPSSMITAWDGKKTVQAVIENNHKLTKVSTLAVKIAKEAVFGEMVMRKCTPMGSRELPGLPRKELFQIKQALFDLFPSYWKNSEDFETIWATCIDSIGQACKRLRSKKP